MNWQALRDLAGQGYAPRALLDVGAHVGSFSRAFSGIFPGCTPVLIEPNPHCASALQALPFEWHAFAASNEDGEAELHLTKEWLQSTGASIYRENTHFFRDDVVLKTSVPKRRLDDVFPGRRFDVVKIDTQGAELDVLRGGRALIAQADFVLIEVSLVNYNAGGAKAEDVFAELEEMNFSCAGALEFHRLKGVGDGNLLQIDFLFENKRRRMPMGEDGLASFVTALENAGRDGLAKDLMEHLAGLRSPMPEMLRCLTAQAIQRGALPEALGLLQRWKAANGAPSEVAAMIGRVAGPAAERINALTASREWDAAAHYAIPLAELLPGYAPAQRAAAVINANLARHEQAGNYADRLLALDPGDAEAANIADRAKIVAESKPAYAKAVCQALFPAPGSHPLINLRDFNDAASAILCAGSDAGDEDRLREILKRAGDVELNVPDSPELAGWLAHYRLSLAAMNPDVLTASQPQSIASPPSITDANGNPVSPAQFERAVAAMAPKAVFFVAADSKYMDLYARHYVDSIVRRCDVPFVIVLHVIGGSAALSSDARSMARQIQNLFLTGDAFEASAVVTKCYETPPKGLLPHPAAHYQSARFQWLGWLLSAVNAPVFVSDIDLLLQRGVADLLDREAGSDVVLNENTYSLNAGSRLTANLLLLNPTPLAQAFAAALKTYLDKALNGPEVSRWIDQFGLIMARNWLRRARPDVKIGYFDTDSDINNVMYRSFEKNPFRFLSLYHGFDMASLERAA
jgi:FkbM family methyltransferase